MKRHQNESVTCTTKRWDWGVGLVLSLLCAGAATLSAATTSVTSLADSGPGSLRSALANAASGDTIDATGVSGTILLTSGELLITNSVTINGPGPANLAIDGNFPNTTNRVFHITSSVAVNISGLTITNGNNPNGGGGIYNFQSELAVSNCTISGNSSSLTGGGIWSLAGISGSAKLTVVNSLLSSNSGGVGGAIYSQSAPGLATLVLVGSKLIGNSAGGAGGGALKNAGSGNGSNNAMAAITNCTFSGNTAGGNGGAIENDGSGGSAALTVVNSTLTGNSADLSGTGFGGGAIVNSGDGGNAPVMLINTTLSANSTASGGGAIFNGGPFGGGNTRVTLIGCTLSGNLASSSRWGGGCIFNWNGGQIEMGNTILNAGSSVPNITTTSSSPFTSLGNNLSSDDGSGFLTNATDVINTDPMLGPLQDNGGPTFTHALLPCSPAIDRGTNFGFTTDQRGYLRPVDDPAIANAPGADGSDIGAFEVQQHQPCPFAITGIKQIGTGPNLRLSYTTVLGSNYVVQARPDLAGGIWTNLPGTNVGIGVVMQSILTNALAAPQSYYRVQQL